MPSLVEDQFDNVRRFVEVGRLEDALDCLAEVEGFQQHAPLLRFRLSRIQEQDRKGLRPRNELDAEFNKLSDDILGLISEDLTSFGEDQEAPQSPYAYLRPVLKEPPFILPQLDTPSFTGRQTELQQLESAIFNPVGPRMAGIAGLTGAGGMGKSVLAFHFATIYRDRFPDGVIGLRVDNSDPEILAQRFASDVGATIPPSQKLTASEIMQSVFQNKQALLIFDNAEDATVKLLRPGGNRCAVIVTTRNKGLLKNLEIPEAGQVDLDPFTLEEARELLGKIIGNQRVEAEPEAVEKIHELVGGLPLAIRIVGGTLDDQPFTRLAEYAELLRDEKARLTLLRDSDDPDLNVEASFELSLKWLESLKETEVIKTFACLGACPHEGFSILAAQVVSEQDEFAIKGIMGRLTRLSLVNRGDQTDEFTLHPLLFLFARRKAENDGWLSGAEQRHTDFFLSYIQDHSEPSSDNFKALETELKSLLLAGRRLAASKQPNYEFYVALEPFLETNGYWSEALDLVELLSEAARATNNFLAMAQLSLQRGQFLQLRGKFDEAQALLLESESFALQIENSYRRERTRGMILNSLGGVYQRQGDFNRAISTFEQSRQISEEQGDERGLAMVLNSLGSVYQRQGDFNRAISTFEQSRKILKEQGDERSLAIVLNSLGGVYQRQGDFNRAISTFEQGKKILEEQGDKRSLAMVLNSLGGVYQRQGDFNRAISTFEQSRQISEEQGDERGLAMVLNSLGSVYQRQGDFNRAISTFEKSRQISEEQGDERSLAMVLNSLGGVYQRQGDFNKAITAFEQSRKILEEQGDERGLAMVLTSLGGVYQRQGDFNKAITAFEQSRKIHEEQGDERGLAILLNSLGGVYQRLEMYAEAIEALKRSADLQRRFNDLRGLAMVLNSLGGAYRKQVSPESWVEAVSVLKQSEEIEEKLGNLRGQAMVLNSLGDVYQRLHDFDGASAVLQKSYDLSVSLNDVRGQAMVLTSLGQVYQQNGDLDGAVKVFEQGIAIEEAIGNRRGQAMVLCAWGKALLNHRDPLEAAEKLRLSFEIDESLRNAKGMGVVTPSLVRALTILRRREEARDYVARALAIAPTAHRLLTLQEQLAESHQVSLETIIKTGNIKRLLRKPSGYIYGFIVPEDEGEDIYFGEESIARSLLPNLVEGAKVRVEFELSARGPRAQHVWDDELPHGSTPE
jgi:tetratricopeptide (TPR) repeat protein